VVFLFVAGCLYGAYALFLRRPVSGSRQNQTDSSGAPAASDGDRVEIGIAYDTEKERWLQWAVAEFARTDLELASEALDGGFEFGESEAAVNALDQAYAAPPRPRERA
jgi:hypothetical protein